MSVGRNPLLLYIGIHLPEYITLIAALLLYQL